MEKENKISTQSGSGLASSACSPLASEIKEAVSTVLQDALRGAAEYRTEDGFIRWGRVEADIHGNIESIIEEDGATRFVRMIYETVTGGGKVVTFSDHDLVEMERIIFSQNAKLTHGALATLSAATCYAFYYFLLEGVLKEIDVFFKSF